VTILSRLTSTLLAGADQRQGARSARRWPRWTRRSIARSSFLAQAV